MRMVPRIDMSELHDLIIVLRTQSDIEASVVRGLLETHGIQALLASDVPHSVLPLAIDGLGEVRLSVRADQAEAAARLIADYRDDVAARSGKIGDELQTLEQALDYDFRDKGLLEHALTHRSRAHEGHYPSLHPSLTAANRGPENHWIPPCRNTFAIAWRRWRSRITA